MMAGQVEDVTRILAAVERGEADSARQLLPLVYAELRKLASQRLARETPGQTLQPTALVHEAYLRLVGPDGRSDWQGRAHFFAAAAEAMRRILVDGARHKQSLKGGGGRRRLDLSGVEVAAEFAANTPSVDVLALDEALGRLAREHPRKAELVKLRFFAGLTNPEAADALGISLSTANDDWAFARCWLRVELGDGAAL
jgi:RNA polymerase sigma factor (TIGR02999 family)